MAAPRFTRGYATPPLLDFRGRVREAPTKLFNAQLAVRDHWMGPQRNRTSAPRITGKPDVGGRERRGNAEAGSRENN